MFPSCRKCCEDLNQNDCDHDRKEDRILHGTWVAEEIKMAVLKGYVIKSISEIWDYKTVQYNPETGEEGLLENLIN